MPDDRREAQRPFIYDGRQRLRDWDRDFRFRRRRRFPIRVFPPFPFFFFFPPFRPRRRFRR